MLKPSSIQDGFSTCSSRWLRLPCFAAADSHLGLTFQVTTCASCHGLFYSVPRSYILSPGHPISDHPFDIDSPTGYTSKALHRLTLPPSRRPHRMTRQRTRMTSSPAGTNRPHRPPLRNRLLHKYQNPRRLYPHRSSAPERSRLHQQSLARPTARAYAPPLAQGLPHPLARAASSERPSSVGSLPVSSVRRKVSERPKSRPASRSRKRRGRHKRKRSA